MNKPNISRQWNRLNEVKIRTMLYERNLTQQQLADMAGTSRATVCAICNGKSCSFDTAYKIAKAFDVSIEEMMEVINGDSRRNTK